MNPANNRTPGALALGVCQVAADNEKEAIEKALADSHVFGRIDTENNWELDELDTYKYLFHGNIEYTNLSEASAEESDELDPEDLE